MRHRLRLGAGLAVMAVLVACCGGEARTVARGESPTSLADPSAETTTTDATSIPPSSDATSIPPSTDPSLPTTPTSVVPPQADVISGFGVNGQPRNWGTDGRAVKPALALLVNDLGATQFRVEINRGESDWEQQNDDADPNHFNWDVYDQQFSTKDFTDLWDYVRELNSLGVDNIELSAHGLVPDWMGQTSVPASAEDEFVETMLAFLVYATTRSPEPRPQFRYFSPWNETDYGPPEGVDMDVEQMVRILKKLTARMDAIPELANIKIVAPESSGEETSIALREALTAEPAVMEHLAAFGFHRYGRGQETQRDYTGSQPPEWLTEFNDGAGFCYRTDWQDGLYLAGNLVTALQGGVTAGLVWTDYDAPHSHSGDRWESFGLLATTYQGTNDLCGHSGQPTDEQLDAVTYEPKATYEAMKHFFHYIRPGATRIPITIEGRAMDAVAFRNLDGSVVVVGENSGPASDLKVTFGAPVATARLLPIVSTADQAQVEGAAVPVDQGTATLQMPAESVFTLVGQASP